MPSLVGVLLGLLLTGKWKKPPLSREPPLSRDANDAGDAPFLLGVPFDVVAAQGEDMVAREETCSL